MKKEKSLPRSSKFQNIVCLMPPHHDFLCAAITEGLKLLGYSLYCSELANNACEHEYIPLRDIGQRCQDADLVLLFSNTAYSSRKRFVQSNNLEFKTVYVDGSDRSCLEDRRAMSLYPLCFKRECPTRDSRLTPLAGPKNPWELFRRFRRYHLYRGRVLPLNLAAERAYFEYSKNTPEKDISVSCTLVPKKCCPKREKIINFVKELQLPHSIAGRISSGSFRTAASDASKRRYFKVLARSRISISFPGYGFDTGRFWEILASRSLLFSPRIQVQMPHPFVELEHYVPFDSLEELRRRLLYYLENDEQREKIAMEGYKHLLRYHTSEQRARYLLEMTEQMLER